MLVIAFQDMTASPVPAFDDEFGGELVAFELCGSQQMPDTIEVCLIYSISLCPVLV